MQVAVLTVDQRSSRSGADLVPALLVELAPYGDVLGFERTVGDEVQGTLADPRHVARATASLLRSGAWNIGIGIGQLELPIPSHTRAARGSAYLHARNAVTAAKSAPWHLRVCGDDEPGVRALESALLLWAHLLGQRTAKGWEVVDLLDTGLTHEQAAERLGITQSAVSQRARAAGLVEGRRALELTGHLVGPLLEESR